MNKQPSFLERTRLLATASKEIASIAAWAAEEKRDVLAIHLTSLSRIVAAEVTRIEAATERWKSREHAPRKGRSRLAK